MIQTDLHVSYNRSRYHVTFDKTVVLTGGFQKSCVIFPDDSLLLSDNYFGELLASRPSFSTEPDKAPRRGDQPLRADVPISTICYTSAPF